MIIHKLVTDPSTFKVRRTWKTDYLYGCYWRNAECGVDLTERTGGNPEEYSDSWIDTTCRDCLLKAYEAEIVRLRKLYQTAQSKKVFGELDLLSDGRKLLSDGHWNLAIRQYRHRQRITIRELRTIRAHETAPWFRHGVACVLKSEEVATDVYEVWLEPAATSDKPGAPA